MLSFTKHDRGARHPHSFQLLLEALKHHDLCWRWRSLRVGEAWWIELFFHLQHSWVHWLWNKPSWKACWWEIAETGQGCFPCIWDWAKDVWWRHFRLWWQCMLDQVQCDFREWRMTRSPPCRGCWKQPSSSLSRVSQQFEVSHGSHFVFWHKDHVHEASCQKVAKGE